MSWWKRVSWLKIFAAGVLLAVIGISVAASSGVGKPVLDAIHSVPGADTLGHFLLIGSLAFVVSLAAIGTAEDHQLSQWLKVVVGLASLATIDELLQLVLPRRAFAVSDLLANFAGIVVFSLFALLIRRKAATVARE